MEVTSYCTVRTKSAAGHHQVHFISFNFEFELLLRRIEIFQVRRRLTSLDRHDGPIAAEIIDLLADGDPGLTFDATIFPPPDLLRPTVVLHHRPGPRQRVVDRGHLIVEDA